MDGEVIRASNYLGVVHILRIQQRGKGFPNDYGGLAVDNVIKILIFTL